MLPFPTDLVSQYINLVNQQTESSHTYTRMYEDVNTMQIARAIDLVGKDRAVLAMDNATVKAVSEGALPQTHQGASYGPSKQVNDPQKASRFSLDSINLAFRASFFVTNS